MIISKIKFPSKDELQNIVDNSSSLAEILSFLGYRSRSGETMKNLKQRIIDDKIDTTIYKENKKNRKKRINIPLEEIFVENSSYSRSQLKKRMIKEGYLINECSICKLGDTWLDKPIVHILDHINGVNNDNRRHNLRLLCPNCNSQQETFAGKNVKIKTNEILHSDIKTKYCIECNSEISRYGKNLLCRKCTDKENRKAKRPKKKELIILLQTFNFVKVGIMFGVSDNAVRKWCKLYGLSTKSKDYSRK